MSLLDEIVPTSLHTFTPQTLDALRTAGKQEGLYFEFKGQWPATGVAKTVCAYANAYGGFLVLGATQTADAKIDRFPGLDPSIEWPLRIKDQVVGHVSSLPVWDAVSVTSPDNPPAKVAVVRVEASDQTPHVVTDSGIIYQRTPGGSDPVKDKATIDQLVARGSGVQARLSGRIVELCRTPLVKSAWAAEAGWRLEVAAIPVPSILRSHSAILTKSGYEAAGAVFQGLPSGAPIPVRPMEDGVLLRSDRYEVARYDDGSVYGRLIIPPNYADKPVGAHIIRAMLVTLLDGQARFEPPVRQSYVWVQLSGILGKGMSDEWAPGGWVSDGVFTADSWTYGEQLTTTRESAEALADQIRRRLWRNVGERVFDPEAQ